MVLNTQDSFADEKSRLGNTGQSYGGTGHRGIKRTGIRTSSISSAGPDQCTVTWEGINIWAPTPSQGCVSCMGRGSDTADSDGVAKQILYDVSGIVRPGELLAIMGASGAGKTTLMNHLTTQGARLRNTGEVRVNGKKLGNEIKHISAYVQQDDVFMGSLTVREHLLFQAQLRVEAYIPYKVRVMRVDEVMEELQLTPIADQQIGKPGAPKALSGGERKRLSFASEVITNPPIMFCDEPTSGLDSYMAQMVVESLRALASKGRTILCTIHQPSSEVYSLMDRICFMAEGRVAYIGDTESALKFFAGVGHPCPPTYNPGDYFIHTLAVIPGQEEKCRANIKEIVRAYNDSTVHLETMQAIQKSCHKDKFVSEMEDVSEKLGGIFGESNDDLEGELSLQYKSSWGKQFRLLFWRTWITSSRDPAINRARLFQTIVISIVMGMIYWQQVYDQKGVFNIDGALFLLISQLTYGNIYAVVNSFPAEYPLFKREHMNGMYRVTPYYLSHVLADIPIFILVPFLMSVITYWMIGFYATTAAFFSYFGILTLMTFVTVAFGHMLSTLTVNVTLAVALAPILVNPLMFFGGYFLNTDSVPWYMTPLEWLSWFYYTNEMLVVNQWQNIEHLVCEYGNNIYVNGSIVARDTSMCFTDGAAVIQSFSFSEDRMWYDACGLFILFAMFEALAFIFIQIRARQR